MTVRRINKEETEEYTCKSGDTKPEGVPAGSTCEYTDTGEQFKYDGEDWNPDLTLIHALSVIFDL